MPNPHTPPSRSFPATARRALGLLASLFGLTACTVVGPSAIYSGRIVYNAAISETNNQQILAVLVHNRYGENSHLLNIASVTANVSVRSSAGIQAGFGNNSNYEGNLVPFTGGVAYEENPTISYIPVSGEKYIRQISTPVPIDLVARLVGTQHDPQYLYHALVRSANDVLNPAFLFNDRAPDPRFTRFIELMTELSQSQRLRWYVDTPLGTGFSISTHDPSPGQHGSPEDLLRLLSLSGTSAGETPQLHIPVVGGVAVAPQGALRIETRSIMELVEVMSSQVEVPANDLHSGVAATFPRGGDFAHSFRVRYASSKPESAYVSVEHREGWYYIDEADQASKRAFKLLSGLWNAAMSNTLGERSSAPVLTVPVSR